LLGDTDEGLVEVWDTNEMRSVRRLQHEGKVMSGSFDPSESYLVTASDDRAARIWQLATGEQVAQFEHDADVWAAEFSPDGKYVLSAGGRSDRTARLWLWRPRDLIAEACSRLSRDLKPEEWNQYLGAETYRPTRQWNEEELK
jgi:WD40 repeat protein